MCFKQFKQQFRGSLKRQTGLTLMELLIAIGVALALVAGTLAVLNSTRSGASAMEMTKHIITIRQSVQTLFMQQGTYGAANLNSALITANQIPTTLNISGNTINTPFGGTLTVTGNTSNFRIAITNVPADACTTLLTQLSNGWASVQVGASTITTFPVAPTTATLAANCGGTAPFTITWTSIN